ncbi:2TM domain-containing protein [Maribacter sp. X9]|uniref:2TM domain-containing protein n=1 Tax=Maribacter sp. X9 TaxID=3402159 RepID=UPI003AF3553C
MENQKYYRAKERVETIKKFYGSMLSSLFTIFIVGGINYYIDEWHHPWFLWVVFGLGIGLFFKALKIFNFNPFMNRDWEERKIQEFMKQEENKQRWN